MEDLSVKEIFALVTGIIGMVGTVLVAGRVIFTTETETRALGNKVKDIHAARTLDLVEIRRLIEVNRANLEAQSRDLVKIQLLLEQIDERATTLAKDLRGNDIDVSSLKAKYDALATNLVKQTALMQEVEERIVDAVELNFDALRRELELVEVLPPKRKD